MDQKIQRLTQMLDALAKRVEQANKAKYNPIDPKAFQDIKDLSDALDGLVRRVGTSNAGGGFNPVNGIGGGGNPTTMPPPSAPPPPAPGASPDDGSGSPHRGRGRWSNYGQYGTGGRFFNAFSSSFGGGFQTVAGEAMSGAGAGGGFSAAGLLRGGLIGAGLFSAFKAGQALSEGYDNAKTLALEMDKLKRQMGDIGVSFETLTLAAEKASNGLEVNSVEAGKLMQEFNRLSGGTKDTADLMEGTRSGTGMAKALGLDPSAGVSFLANIRNITRGGSVDGDRRLALMIGDVVTRSGMNARADEVLQAIQAFAAATSRISLTSPNINGYSGAYAGLMSSRIPGLTSDTAAAMLGQANTAMQNMGAFGDASETFTLSALGRFGNLNPIQARVLSEGGLFGTRAGSFGKGSLYRRYAGDEAADALMGSDPNMTNFEAVRRQLDSMNVTPDLKAEMAKNFFGLSSISQAMALLSMKPEEMGRTEALLGKRGININDYNETGILTLSKIANAGGMADLNTVGNDLLGRTGKGALDPQQRRLLTKAMAEANKMGGDAGFKKLQDVLTDLSADKDKQQTLGSQMLDQQKRIETAMTSVGKDLLGPLTDMKELLMAGFGMSENKARERVVDLRKSEINQDYDKKLKPIDEQLSNAKWSLLEAKTLRTLGAPRSKELVEDWEKKVEELEKERQAIIDERDGKLKEVDEQAAREAKEREAARNLATGGAPGTGTPVSAANAERLSKVKLTDDQNAILQQVSGGDENKLTFLRNVLKIENRGNERVNNNAVSPAGARGAFQFMPDTAASVARKIGMKSFDLTNFGDSAKLAAGLYDELYTRHNGDRARMYSDYNGGPRLAKRAGATGNRENDEYVGMALQMDREVQSTPATPVPKGEAPKMSLRDTSGQPQMSLAPWAQEFTFHLVDKEGTQRANPIKVSVPYPQSTGR